MGRKQPKLVLRESCIADASAAWLPGPFVEMGAGTGEMTRLFLDRGFTGATHDLGEGSRQMMRANLARYGDRVQVVDMLEELQDGAFDYLFAFEVLEHIEDDGAALEAWSRKLRPGGRILLSVPAHQRKFGRSDVLVGHIRRYERDGLAGLLAAAGFRDMMIVNYGYPVTELTRRLSNFLVRKDRSYDAMTPVQRSIRSAQAKPAAIGRWLGILDGTLVLPFCSVQRWFYRFDLGDGLVATAVKRN